MPAGSTYTPIATTTGNGSSATVSFTSISGTYTDLILILATDGGYSLPSQDLQVKINSDTGSNYSRTYLLGNGTAASSGRTPNATFFAPTGISANGNLTMHFLNYSNSTTYKTILTRPSMPAEYAATTVGLWRSTSAITRIDLTAAVSWTTGSTFTLYGIASA